MVLKIQTHTPVNTNTFHARKAHLSADSYLNLGCLLMASSGKNSDLATELSAGLSRYSGLVKPGQPNLHSKPKQVYQEIKKPQRTANYLSQKTVKESAGRYRGNEVMVQRVWFWLRTEEASRRLFFMLPSTVLNSDMVPPYGCPGVPSIM